MAFIEKGDRAAFQRALRLGHGSAGVYLEEFGDAGVEEDILHACKVNISYDRQLSTSSGMFVYHLLQATGKTQFYRDQLFVLAAAEDSDKDLIREMLLQFGKLGDQEARQFVNQHFDDHYHQDEWLITELVAMDGVDGFLRGFDVLVSHPDLDQEDVYRAIASCVNTLKVEHDWQLCAPLLTESSKLRPLLSKVLTEIEELANSPKKKPINHRLPFETPEQFFEVLEKEENMDRDYPLWVYGRVRYSSDEIILLAAQTLVAAESSARQKPLLRAFGFVPFPLDPTLLFKFMESDIHLVRWWTCIALSKMSSPVIREFALANYEERFTPHETLKMLLSSCTSRDVEWINNLVRMPQDEDDLHWSLCDAFEIYKNTPDFESKELLDFAYENQPCCLCRYHLVELMIKREFLNDQQRRECKWDSGSDTRELVKTSRAGIPHVQRNHYVI